MKEVLLGTIGSGFIVDYILKNVEKVDGIKLVATYSRTMGKAFALKDKYHGEYAYDDLDEFVNSEYINTIYIASPNSLHYEQAKKALEAKKNVLLEKPFAPRLNEAKELLDLAKKNNVMIIDATPTFFLPNLPLIKERVKSIGDIKLIMGNYSQYSSKYDALQRGEIPNVFNREYSGGALMDINYYNVYLTVALFGKPKEGFYYPNKHENGIDTSGTIQLNYPGFKVSLVGAKDTWGVNYYQVEGNKGYVYVVNGSNELKEVRLVTKTSDELVNEQPNPERWYYDVLGFTKLLIDEDKETIEENHKVMLETIEVIESIRRNANIEFPGD